MVSSFPPSAVPNWMHKLKNGAYVSNKILERCLLSSMSDDEASQAVEDAITKGILVPKGKATRAKGKRISLCFSQKISELKPDPYCFECHFPGSEPLKKCLSCDRCFHAACQRKNPHRPNYSVPSDKGQPHRFPLNESDMEDSCDEEEVETQPTSLAQATPTAQADSCGLDYNSNINVIPPDPLKREADSSDDVFFVSEKPARQRKRRSTFIKSEEAPNEATDELELCTPCRLLKLADLLNPPHVSIEELNCLLGYSWQTHHTWLKKDVRKYMAKHWSEPDATIVKSVLFQKDILGLSDISTNIELKKYKHLSEFLIDLLDLQHNTGIFFGTNCEEYNATKWLLRDITHDIREIRRCSDCYRYSNESDRSPFWFAKPCTQRHELVYAKQCGSPHWPAKVIRVISKRTDIYDVRYFGGTHSRALVSARDILPIDADISQLNTKWKSTRTFNLALRELRCHMMLLHQPMYLFNFYADPREAEELINRALPHCMEPADVNVSAKRSRAGTPASAKKRKITSATISPLTSKRIQPTRRCSMIVRSEAFREMSLHIAQSLPSLGMREPFVGYQAMLQEVLFLNEELTRSKTELENMKEELKTVKRKRWCQHCLQEAEFDCCFTASYCSDECKRRDKRRHQGTCSLQSKS
ncbi:PREDICTED: zinc finger MYND domain-containing protein 11 [Drosophila arizonae]|uniref:Zinc finger MYND domain-containing protein 11 n=1 Tax=Drosophila arizonae TaxID=7263 RepID=A0ABM1PNU3_DROAR|nr:PREDICTED: zinc finger MYND domain-containing protein 11 [Drosophila arizonae]